MAWGMHTNTLPQLLSGKDSCSVTLLWPCHLIQCEMEIWLHMLFWRTEFGEKASSCILLISVDCRNFPPETSISAQQLVGPGGTVEDGCYHRRSDLLYEKELHGASITSSLTHSTAKLQENLYRDNTIPAHGCSLHSISSTAELARPYVIPLFGSLTHWLWGTWCYKIDLHLSQLR